MRKVRRRGDEGEVMGVDECWEEREVRVSEGEGRVGVEGERRAGA